MIALESVSIYMYLAANMLRGSVVTNIYLIDIFHNLPFFVLNYSCQAQKCQKVSSEILLDEKFGKENFDICIKHAEDGQLLCSPKLQQ